ncbi:MAG: EpsI family protein [Acidobacteriaceae bacterium]|nr:EpsI family protein [Acidobacteriaceae bacterium]MBV9499559.1 EpsI family protein [Acidobacteriaceae bacterium]
MRDWFKSKTARILTIVLLVQAAAFYAFASRKEMVPSHLPLADFSLPGGSWSVVEELPMDKDSLEVLKADDILSRLYTNQATGQMATLFVAYFETQRTGKTPHSPKNCLPGAGWAQTQSGAIDITVPGEQTRIRVNRYVVAKGDNQSVVLYWYQAHQHVIASEYSAKLFTITDAIRFDRTDTSLVRVVVGVNNGDISQSVKTAVSFVQAIFEPLKQYLPA